MKIRRASLAVASAALGVACALALPLARGTVREPTAPASSAMTAEQIADKSVEVRGGLEAWRKVVTLIWEGHLETARSAVQRLPFRLEEKRPGKSRFEITEPSQRSMRVFNGVSGWKMKLGQDGRPEVKQFASAEVRFARSAPGLEGPLIDFRAKGSTVELQGTDEIDGRRAYRVGIRLATDERLTVWVDAESFLEARYDRDTHIAGGTKATVSVRLRDYKEVEGLAVPSVIEISGGAGGKPDRMVIERVALNPEIDDRDFEDLGAQRGRSAVESKAAAR